MTTRPRNASQAPFHDSERPFSPRTSSTKPRLLPDLAPLFRNIEPQTVVNTCSLDENYRPNSDPSSRFVVRARHSLPATSSSDIAAKTSKSLLQIRFETSPNLVQQISEFVAAFSKLRFLPTTAHRIALASYELVKNAISYGSVTGDVLLSIFETDRCVEVCITNQSCFGRVANLRSKLERLQDANKRSPEKPVSPVARIGSGGFGLARICQDGQMDLECELDGNCVTMRAKCAR